MFGQEERRKGKDIFYKKQAQTRIAKRKRCLFMPCGLMNESSFGLLTEGLITKGLTEEKGHMPCGPMKESRFGLLTEGVITKGCQCQHFNVNLSMLTFKCQPFIVSTSRSTLYFQQSYTHFCSVVIMKVKLLSHR